MEKIIVFNIGTNIGGIEVSLIQFLQFLVRQNCSVDLVLWKKPGELYKEIPPEVHILPSPAPGGWGELHVEKNIHARVLKFFRILQYKIDIKRGCAWKHFQTLKKKYDVAISYCQNGYSPYYVIDKVCAKKHILFYHHGSYDADAEQYEKDRYYYNCYDQIITVSETNRKMLAEHFPELKNKIFVVNNQIDVERIRLMAAKTVKEFDLNKNCKIVTVGRVSKEKGQLFSLEVAKELIAMQFPFQWLFVGDGPEIESCLNMLSEFGLTGKCAFIGRRENPYPYIKQADIYVQSSYVEADPLTLQEAILLCKPIVASDIPAIRATLENGKLGTLCEFSPKSFAEKVIERYNSPLTQELSQYESNIAARNTVSENLLKEYLNL